MKEHTLSLKLKSDIPSLGYGQLNLLGSVTKSWECTEVTLVTIVD